MRCAAVSGLVKQNKVLQCHGRCWCHRSVQTCSYTYLYIYKCCRYSIKIQLINLIPIFHKSIKSLICGLILSCASEVGSPTNHLGSGQRRDKDQGPFSPLRGGLDLTPTGSLQDKVYLMTDYLKCKNTDQHWTCFTKAG